MDIAHKQTDKTIEALERRIRKIYADAQKDIQKKTADFWARHAVKDRVHRQELKDGKITKEQYQSWMRGQVFQGKQWEAKLSQITQTLVNADKVAQSIINGEIYGVFANNANWQSYTLEHGAGVNFGFELYDASTVAKLLKDQPELLPKYRLDIPEDMVWNQKLITQQITQGIIQGEDIFQIAKRMANVTDRDENLCLTRARTAMTGAENAGRQESLTRANGMGIKTEKEWLATLDGHTRSQHARLDGQHVPTDKKFRIDRYEIEYPGDPHAHPAMRYNCRCTMVGRLVDYPDEYNAKRYDNIDGKPIKDMSYSEWKKEKPVESVEKPKARKETLLSVGEYRYHATTPPALIGIYNEGLKPNRGMLGKGVYFAPTKQDALDWAKFSSTGGNKLLRVSTEYLADKTDYDDYDETQGLTTKKIPKKYIEVQMPNGEWISLEDYAKKNYRAFGIIRR